MNLTSKAKTLEDLQPLVKCSKILPVLRFFVNDYLEKREVILRDILSKFNVNLIVRSSSASEDNLHTSNAGGFDSVLNVDVFSVENVKEAIELVISSYGEEIDPLDEVFVQPMLKNVSMAGVIFTADLDTLSPYYIINYDKSGSTSSVTSGESNELKTFICPKGGSEGAGHKKLTRLIKAAKECEEIFENSFLDIEFAFSNDDLYILQVRAIVLNNKENLSKINLLNGLGKLKKKIKKLNAPHPNLLGSKVLFGVMPDWNPAEIIGVRPKKLALTLYKELITDETWAYQRDNYGYRNLRSHPLLVSFLGVPYIDVRVSFNSFIPKYLSKNLAIKLVNYYLNKLSNNVSHHDKIEFEIVYSCFYFGIEKRLSKLHEYGFNDTDLKHIKDELLDLTNNIIDTKNGLYKKDLEKAEVLVSRFNEIVESDLSLVDKIYWLIKDVKRYGTLPFAGVARAGFIAMQMLRSMVDEKVIQEEDYNCFLSSINTVSKQLSKDIHELPKIEFIEKYGHLRPGTYDILSERYDEAYDSYFGGEQDNRDMEVGVFSFTQEQMLKIDNLISVNALNTDSEHLIVFIREAIEARESVKFIFTKHLSQVLKYIDDFGRDLDLTKEKLAHLDIQVILNLYATLDDRNVKDILHSDIEKNRALHQYTKAVKLPNIIADQNIVDGFFLEENEANYITLKQIESDVIIEENIFDSNLEGKIICIQSADPGYDYLFSKNIGGLITCYGGANSHMAIRCAEMGIPAVIGCGQNNFSKYGLSKRIEIDALNKMVSIRR